jgi:hypothetical protein
VIINLYPEYSFEIHKFEKSGRGAMRVFSILKMMFPEYSLKWRYRFKDIRFASSGYPIELDIYMPEFNWGIEYQGVQHRKMPSYWGGKQASEEIFKRDNEKRKLYKGNNIVVEEIWDDEWNGSPYKLIKLIKDKNLHKKFNLTERLKKLEGKKILYDADSYSYEEDINNSKYQRSLYSWDHRYDQLTKYIQLYNTLPTSVVSPTDDETIFLKNWISRQIHRANKGELLKYQKNKLLQLGIIFNKTVKEQRWFDMYEQLILYKNN